jgi:two-component SAPR family response regulator
MVVDDHAVFRYSMRAMLANASGFEVVAEAATGEKAEAAILYDQAIELYRGDYLVEDLYEDWTMVERERLSNAYMDILGRLARHYLDNGRPEESVRCCYRALEKDRCHEDSHRLLMRCYSRMGQLSRVARQYTMCERILEQEYGVAPSPETNAILHSIMMGEARSDDLSQKISAGTRPVPHR